MGLAPGFRVELDGFLVLLINAVQDRADAYCGRRLGRSTYTNQLFDGDGSNVIILPHFPVDLTSSGVVFELYEDATRSFAASSLLTRWVDGTALGSAHYRVDAPTGVVERFNGSFPYGSGVIRVNYTAGYSHDDQLDLVLALMEECRDWWSRRGRDPSVASGSLAGFSATIRTDDLSPKVKAILGSHSQGIW